MAVDAAWGTSDFTIAASCTAAHPMSPAAAAHPSFGSHEGAARRALDGVCLSIASCGGSIAPNRCSASDCGNAALAAHVARSSRGSRENVTRKSSSRLSKQPQSPSSEARCRPKHPVRTQSMDTSARLRC
jgi:hypothetical protein